MSYVNYLGEQVVLDPTKHEKPKVKKEQPAEYHNGWRVQGIPPGALEEACASHSSETALAASSGRKLPKPWDEANWLMNAKRKPVRNKPYEVPEAAQLCKQMAERAGWLRVEVVELKKTKTAQ